MKYISMNAEMTKAILDRRKTQARRVVSCNNYNKIMLNALASKCGYASENYGCGHKESGDVDKDGKGRCFTWSCPLAICGYEDYSSFDGDNYVYVPKPEYQKDEIIWVREPAKIDMCFTEEIHFHYSADSTTSKLSIPKRFIKDGFVVDWMAHCNGVPNGCIKEMARIFLKITNIRVEKLHDIYSAKNNFKGYVNEGITYDKEYAKKINNDLYLLNLKVIRDFTKLWNKTAQKGYKWEDNPYVFVYEFKVLDNKEIK